MKKFEVHFTKVFDRAEEIAILSCQKRKKLVNVSILYLLN